MGIRSIAIYCFLPTVQGGINLSNHGGHYKVWGSGKKCEPQTLAMPNFFLPIIQKNMYCDLSFFTFYYSALYTIFGDSFFPEISFF